MCPDYPKYGGKGVRMCREWMDDFWAFYTFIGPRPSPRHSVGRVKNELGYQPVDPATGEVQVRWEIKEEQARNQTHNRRIRWRGEEHILVQLAEKIGITPVGLSLRIAKAEKFFQADPAHEELAAARRLVIAQRGDVEPATPEEEAVVRALAFTEAAVEKAMTDTIRRIKTALGDKEQMVVDRYLQTGDSASALVRWLASKGIFVSQRTVDSSLVRHAARDQYIKLHGADAGKRLTTESTKDASAPDAVEGQT